MSSLALMASMQIAAAGRSDTFTRADSTTSLGTPSDGGAGWTTTQRDGAGNATWIGRAHV